MYSSIFTTKNRNSSQNSLNRTKLLTTNLRTNLKNKNTIHSPVSPNKTKRKTMKNIRQSIKRIQTLHIKLAENQKEMSELVSYELWQKILNDPMECDEKTIEEEELFDGMKRYYEIRVISFFQNQFLLSGLKRIKLRMK
jgi:hypothetical protein